MFKRSPAHSPSSPRYLSPLQLFGSSPSHGSSKPSSRSLSPDPLGYSAPASRSVQSDEALRTVKALEGVLAAWNEYRLAVAQQGRAGRKLASAMRDLGDRTERDGVAFHALQPTAKTVDALSDASLGYARSLERGYDNANNEASLYFHNLARQVRDHETFLANEGKRAVKSEKAYRKASKVMTEGAIYGSGLEGMKDALRLEVETANLNHAMLLGDAQAAILLKVSAALAGLPSPAVEHHSTGLTAALDKYGEIEYYHALAQAGWRDLALPEPDCYTDEAAPGMSRPPSTRDDPDANLGALAAAEQASKAAKHASPSRPRLPIPYPSSQLSERKRHSLPPPPRYASSASLAVLQQRQSGVDRPAPIPIPSPRRRVSEIAADIDSINQGVTNLMYPAAGPASGIAPSRPDSIRAVSMPPTSIPTLRSTGVKPLGSRAQTQTNVRSPPAFTSPSTSTPSQSISTSTSSSTIVLRTPTLHADPSAPNPNGLPDLAGKRRVSFVQEEEDSFPWNATGDREDPRDPWAGVKQPSPRRVPTLSPELRGLMAG